MQITGSTPAVLTVSQLTHHIKLCLESSFRHLWLQGEVSNLTKHSSGHLYFSVKDSGAQIAAVMFRNEAERLGFALKEGAQVILRGEINVYPPSGRYQIVAREMRLVGLGELLAQLEELKKKLHKKGWFEATRKKDIPRFPKRIGIVTSPTGAAIHDILNVLGRRFAGFRVLLNPVRVQGPGSAAEIALAIEQFNHYQLVDVIIVGRGGGSIEDLWAFNEEIVAAAIFNSQIPIISAVGHETDICLSDYVADARAPTPSAAAMMVIAEKEQQFEFMQQMQRRTLLAIRTRIATERQKIAHMLKHPSLTSAYGIMGMWMQRADDLRAQIDMAVVRKMQHATLQLQAAKQQAVALQPTNRIKYIRTSFEEWQKSLDVALLNMLKRHQSQLQEYMQRHLFVWHAHQNLRRKQFIMPQLYKLLDMAFQRNLQLYKERSASLINNLTAMNPKNLLQKGYAILIDSKSHRTIDRVCHIFETQDIKIQLSDGEIAATLTNVQATY